MQSPQASLGKTLSRIGVTLLGLALVLALVLPQVALAGPLAQGSAMSVEVLGPVEVAEGDEFEVSVTVKGVSSLFGGQFELSFDPTYLEAVGGSLSPGGEMEPSVVGVSQIDNVAGSISFAASRQGDVAELAGDIVLATVRFTALVPTQATTIGIGNVLLGDKLAHEVPYGYTQDLTLTITGVAGATVQGYVMLEGRPNGQWDGALVTIDSTSFEAITNPDGSFEFVDVPPGVYTFRANADGYLEAVCENMEVVAPLTILGPVELLAGDVNGDGIIDIVDAVAIGTAFGDPASNPAADLNDDGAINVLDLILMAVNFGVEAPTVWACLDP
ncbi:MAG: hypothetical protein Kow0063_01490 [Anaerolineae bacterium]